jgi:STE24 endopeptidase
MVVEEAFRPPLIPVANEDKATRYHRLRRRASLIGTALGALLLVVLLLTGWSVLLRDLARGIAGDSFVPLVATYVTLVVLISEVFQLPLAFYQGVTLERRYGLSTQATMAWWVDQCKATVLALVFSIGGALIVWSLLRWFPERWWIIAAVCFSFILIALAQLAPVLLMPLFYDVRPLDRPSLVERLVSLANRAGAQVLGVFELRLSDRTRKANAALTGIGRTRRILLSDTLLADHSDDEIEVILAHELAHHVHKDIWKGIALEAVLITLGFYFADRVMTQFAGPLGLAGKADIAGVPLLVLTAGAVSVVLLPGAHGFSRAHERSADRYALEMTKNADAFITAMRRLAVQNLAEERPSRLVETLFHSHPSMASRVAAAQAWAERR